MGMLCSLYVLTCFRSHTEKQHLVKINDNEALSVFPIIFVYRAANESLSEQATEIVDNVVVDLPALNCVVDAHAVSEICADPDFHLDDAVDLGQVTDSLADDKNPMMNSDSYCNYCDDWKKPQLHYRMFQAYQWHWILCHGLACRCCSHN